MSKSAPALIVLRGSILVGSYGLEPLLVGWSGAEAWLAALTAAGPIRAGFTELTPTGERPQTFRLSQLAPTVDGCDRFEVTRVGIAADDGTAGEGAQRAVLQAVLDVSPGPVWAIDNDLRLVAFNEPFFRNTKRDLGIEFSLGDSVVMPVPEAVQSGWGMLYQRALRGASVELEIDPRAPLDTSLDPTHHLSMRPITVHGQIVGTAAYMRDVTRDRQQALSSARQNALLDALAGAQARYIGDAPPNQMFEVVLQSVVELTDSTFGFVGSIRHDDDGQPYLVSTAITDISWSEDTRALIRRTRDTGLEFRNLETLFGHVITTQAPVFCSDAAADPRAGGTPQGHPPIQTFVGLPCMHGDEMVGMVGLANRPGGYDEAMAEFLQPLLATCAQLIVARRVDHERRAAQRALEEAKEAAEAADRAKGEFLAAMSHEIRTPLNAVIGLIELALDGAASDDQQALLRAARNNSETLLDLISDVLDFSRIDAGLIEIDAAPFDLRRLVEDVAEVAAVRAEEKGVALVAAVQARLPSPVVGDAHRVRQVVTNLVSNAVKYTDEGEVVVEVRAERGEGPSLSVVIEVNDTGCGIPSEEHDRIFERFHRVAATAMIGGGGTGLGLAISRFLVERMGGTISVTSTVGIGSRFRVELPLAVTDDSDDGPAPWILGDVRVVVVHPPGGIGQWIARLLGAYGAQVELVADPADTAWLDRADVVLSTVEVEARAPVIRLASVATLGRNRAPGQRCLTLPVRRDDLLDMVLSCVGHTRGARPTPSILPAPATSACAVLLVEDHDDNRAVAARLLATRGHLVDMADNGSLAVERARSGDYDIVLMDLHMPEMDGFEAVRRIRENEHSGGLTPVPIVAVTAHATADVRQRCLASGFDGFVSKPITGQKLSEAVANHARSGATVLVLDDAPDSRRLLVRILRRYTDLRIREAADGDEARALAVSCRPEFALVDAILPGEDGFEIAGGLRAQLGPDATILMVSGRTDPGARTRAAEVGCDGFVQKPVRRQELMSAIEAGMRAVRRDTGSASVIEAPTTYIDDDYFDLVPAFLDDRRADLKLIDAALEAGDDKILARIGHSMKGTGRAYGMDRISRYGGLLERAAREGDWVAARRIRRDLGRFIAHVKVRPASEEEQ